MLNTKAHDETVIDSGTYPLVLMKNGKPGTEKKEAFQMIQKIDESNKWYRWVNL